MAWYRRLYRAARYAARRAMRFGRAPVGAPPMYGRLVYDTGRYVGGAAGAYLTGRAVYGLKRASDRYIDRAMDKIVGRQIPLRLSASPGIRRLPINTSARFGGRYRKRLRPTRSNGRKMRRVPKKLFRGVEYIKQYASTVSDDMACAFTHSTALPSEQLLTFIMMLIKAVLAKKGVYVTDWNALCSGYLATGDIFDLLYKPDVSSLPVTTNFSTSITVSGTTKYLDIASALHTQWKGSLAISTDGIVPVEFRYQHVNDQIVRVPLMDSKISFFIVSHLKIQNRSLAAAGEDEIDVNNVPVYGKVMNGPANGPISRTTAQANFLNGQSTDDMIAGGMSVLTSMNTNPDPSEFTGPKTFGKVGINPGDIKTFSLKSKFVINIQKFMQTQVQYWVGDTDTSKYEQGVFNFIFLERAISKIGGESGVSFAFEVESKTFCDLRPVQQKYTQPYRVGQ